MRAKKKAKSKSLPARKAALGIIGGSGIYQIDGIEGLKEIAVKTPFGNPSDKIMTGNLRGVEVAFLPRHGRGHVITPSEINYRANIYALKSLGVRQIISISACGSLKEELRPMDMVFPDQLYDRTKSRVSTFFCDGVVGHVGFADPFCNRLSGSIAAEAKSLGFPVHEGGTYVCIEGPMFSTRAESNVYRQLGFSIIGMTNLTEAKLAREAEICYSTIALVTDYDVWKADEEVDISKVLEYLRANVTNVKELLKSVIPKLKKDVSCACNEALKYAVITNPRHGKKSTYKKLGLLLDRYSKRQK